MVKKVIIPAAGYGTRSLPITKVLPKEMLPVCGRPAIDFLVEEAISSGIEQILIIVSRSKNMILDYYDRSLELEAHLESVNKEYLKKELSLPDVHIQYVRQPYAKGLGDAILLGKHFVGNEPFGVMLPDEIIITEKMAALAQLIEIYKESKGNIIGLKQMDQADLHKYGVIKPELIEENKYRIVDIIEKPKESPPSNLAVIGRYIFEPSIFNYLSQVKPGVGGEIQLTDAIRKMLKTSSSFGIEIDGYRFDIGNTDEYIKLINFLHKKIKNNE
jgi:UTP--glucose-1-phosphate uridylyltransferase